MKDEKQTKKELPQPKRITVSVGVTYNKKVATSFNASPTVKLEMLPMGVLVKDEACQEGVIVPYGNINQIVTE
jgi:hypothetical protein